MSGDYTLRVDQSRQLVLVKAWGFFDDEMFKRFRSEAYEVAGRLGGNHLSYADFRECTVQTQDIIALA
jgi:hypothetical protein